MEITLDRLANALNKAGVKNSFVEDVLKIEFETAIRDQKDELIVSLITENVATALLKENIKTPFLTCFYYFPESFGGKSLHEATLWANRVNAVALLPGFGIDNANHRVFYRYLLPIVSMSNNIDIIKEVINLAIKIIDIYSESFIRISEGSSCDKLLDEALTEYLADIGTSI